MTAEYRHNPVMLTEVVEAFDLHGGLIVADATLGGAGHAYEFGKRIAPDGILIGIDQDDMALSAAQQKLSDLPLEIPPVLLKGNFGDLDEILLEARVPYLDRILFDIGVSSPQLDIPQRGFSYNEDAFLDMRMDPGTRSLTAAEVIADYSKEDLTRVIRDYGEEKWAARIATFIVEARKIEPITNTLKLVEIIKAAIPASARREGGHPAKRTFQALRIEVNSELEVLTRGLEAAIRWLSPEGIIAVLSYHSLEDRIVKNIFATAEKGCICPPGLPICTCGKTQTLTVITRKAIMPTAEEIEGNPRARSAKLRVAQRYRESTNGKEARRHGTATT